MIFTFKKKPRYHEWVDYFAWLPTRLTDDAGDETDRIVWWQWIQIYRVPAGAFLMRVQYRLKEKS